MVTHGRNKTKLIYVVKGFGYSCLTIIDDNHIGIIYEGVRDLYFQKIPITDLINP